jgi:hypothetical protein
MSPELHRRSPLSWLIALAIVGSPALARADLGGATINFFQLQIHQDGQPLAAPTNVSEATWHYFNQAHCLCALAGQGAEQTFAYKLTMTGQTTVHKPLDMFVGATCDDTVQRPLLCTQVPGVGIADVSTLAVTPAAPEISLWQIMNPKPLAAGAAKDCLETASSTSIFLLSDTTGTSTYDKLGTQSVDFDTQAPSLPTNFAASGSEGGVSLSWKTPLDNATDIYYYQALCAGPDGLPALGTPSEAPKYVTAQSLCGVDSKLTVTPTDIADTNAAAVDAGVATPPAGLLTLDPAYICGSNPSATATSLDIRGLTNGTPYTVALVVMDKWGNAKGTYFSTTLTPKPVTDFWEDLHGRGSKVEGGFCLMAETYGEDGPLTTALRGFRDDTLGHSAAGRWLTDAYYAHVAPLGAYVHGSLALRIVTGVVMLPVVAVALLWHYLTLPGLLALLVLGWAARRWRRRLVARLAPALLLVLLISHHARADSVRPYWDDEITESADTSTTGEVTWHAGVRVGPYTPAIDAQLGMNPGPYQAMFGGAKILPMLDVDRVVWRGFGQVTVGGTVGYMSKSAHAFLDGSDPNDPNRPRSPGDDTTFRLIPMALTAGYRFTYLDDELGIPLVPYVRGGLAYDMWWVKAPNGHTAFVCKDGSATPGCERNSAAGASLGVQGTLGLAIRAERIDESAVRSMRDGGIEHAGFFIELQLAKVDGFGSASKLAVGDNTYFGGVDFEF